VAAAVVSLARVHHFAAAAIHAIVDIASRTIATRNFSVFGRAFAFAVTAAVVCLARVRRGSGVVAITFNGHIFRLVIINFGCIAFAFEQLANVLVVKFD